MRSLMCVNIACIPFSIGEMTTYVPFLHSQIVHFQLMHMQKNYPLYLWHKIIYMLNYYALFLWFKTMYNYARFLWWYQHDVNTRSRSDNINFCIWYRWNSYSSACLLHTAVTAGLLCLLSVKFRVLYDSGADACAQKQWSGHHRYFGGIPGDPNGGTTRVITQNNAGATYWVGKQANGSAFEAYWDKPGAVGFYDYGSLTMARTLGSDPNQVAVNGRRVLVGCPWVTLLFFSLHIFHCVSFALVSVTQGRIPKCCTNLTRIFHVLLL